MKFKPIPIIRFYIRPVIVVLTALFIWANTTPFQMAEESIFLRIFSHIFWFVSMFGWIYILHIEYWDKIFATIYISPKEIVWKCPFRKTIHLPTSGCYIGVELENSHNKLDYEYIYFSKIPYPREKVHKINEIPCSNSFVKYRFSPELAEYILRTLPKEQTKPLDYFYFKWKREIK